MCPRGGGQRPHGRGAGRPCWGSLPWPAPCCPLAARRGLSWLVGRAHFAQGEWRRSCRGGVKVEVLDASAVGLSLARGDYFTANSIVALLALGRYLECASEKKSSDLLTSLPQAPDREGVGVDIEGSEVQIQAERLEIGSLVIAGLRGDDPGGRGWSRRGEASLNQSSITGEGPAPPCAARRRGHLRGRWCRRGRIKIAAQKVGRPTPAWPG